MTQIVGIKELQLNLKRVADAAEKGASFTVVRGSKAVFTINPIVPENRTGNWQDFLKAVSFKGHTDLSQNIDEILYGDNY